MIAVSTFLMFQGNAEDALALYQETFDEFVVILRERQTTPGGQDQVEVVHVDFGGQRLKIFDSPIPHAFDFTPSTSIFIDLEAARFEDVVAALSEGGEFLMPPDDYGFSLRFSFVKDRFGVSWQINVPTPLNDEAPT
ncbi:MAG: VOC family protein [Pseudomonadota bacterium]